MADPIVPVRRLRFDYPDDAAACWTPQRPEFACAANSVSLLMPYLEPWFVRAVGAPMADLDADLAARTRAYLGQESQHHHQHVRLNRLLIDRYRGLTALDRLAGRTYHGLERRSGPAFGLAFAAASETIAYSAARWSVARRRELFEGGDPVMASLFLWHLAEEVEHKSVAFDVQAAVGPGKVRQLAAMAVSLFLVLAFVIAGTTVMLWNERRLHSPVAWIRLTRWAVTFGFELLPNLAVSLLPGFHPEQFTDPLWYEVWLRQLDARDGTLPYWSPEQAPSRARSASEFL